MPTHVRRRLRRLRSRAAIALVLVTGVLAAGTAGAAMTEYQRKQVTQHLHSPQLEPNPAIFDGQAFNPEADVAAAAAYVNSYVDTLNRAVAAWNKLTSGASRSPEGQALLEELKTKLAAAKTMREAFPAFRDTKPSTSAAPPAPAPSPQGGGGNGPAPSAPPASSESTATSGGMTDYQKSQVTQYLDADAMRRDTAVFDGARFVEGAPRRDFDAYYRGYMRNLDRAISAWQRQIPTSAKASPDGQAIEGLLREAMAWGEAMRADHPRASAAYADRERVASAARAQAELSAAADAAAHKQQCTEFQARAMTAQAREPMIRLIGQMQHGNGAIGAPSAVAEHRAVAGAVLEACQAADIEVLTAKPCWYVVGRAESDPKAWCDAAGDAPELIRAMALNHARQTIAVVGDSTIQSPEQFHSREGWLTFEGPVTYDTKLHFTATGREQVMATVQDLMSAVGVEDAEEQLWAGQRQRLDRLRAEVDNAASSWPLPRKAAENYSVALVRTQALEMHPDADVRDAYLGRASWKIHKNALGVPLRRTLPGYVILKLPSDPYCQLRSYTLTEQYAGGGTYQEASGVRIGYVRFQDCP